ncbi:hypothetical protein FACS1894102_0090 [Spirochaetia bacterium]|nr:hypothetical protein FACS1894102_0090 [Spirochaetia bacterium]
MLQIYTRRLKKSSRGEFANIILTAKGERNSAKENKEFYPQITRIDADEKNTKNKIRENPRPSSDKFFI